MKAEVAPLAGAWIETLVSLLSGVMPHVAPLVGALIETGLQCSAALFLLSRIRIASQQLFSDLG